jgi:pimeloyl-ACP methyl ester carboxylesterase
VSGATPRSIKYAYLHGFASGPRATKGLALAHKFAHADLTLHRPDLNQPSFGQLTVSAMLDELDRMHGEISGRTQGEVVWRFVASSLGGWVAALWAQRRPTQVDRLLLLCPGFDMASRWPAMMGADAFAAWKTRGEHAFPDGAGVVTPVHWGLIEDAAHHDPAPAPHPDLQVDIVHGRADVVVDIGSSRRYAAAHQQVELHEVDDDHLLRESIETIWELAQTRLIAPPASDPNTLVTFHWDHFGPQARPTAEHFLIHLDEFLEREAIDASRCTTGVHSESPAHAAAYCTAPARYEDLLVTALRPRRKTLPLAES